MKRLYFIIFLILILFLSSCSRIKKYQARDIVLDDAEATLIINSSENNIAISYSEDKILKMHYKCEDSPMKDAEIEANESSVVYNICGIKKTIYEYPNPYTHILSAISYYNENKDSIMHEKTKDDKEIFRFSQEENEAIFVFGGTSSIIERIIIKNPDMKIIIEFMNTAA